MVGSQCMGLQEGLRIFVVLPRVSDKLINIIKIAG